MFNKLMMYMLRFNSVEKITRTLTVIFYSFYGAIFIALSSVIVFVSLSEDNMWRNVFGPLLLSVGVIGFIILLPFVLLRSYLRRTELLSSPLVASVFSSYENRDDMFADLADTNSQPDVIIMEEKRS